MIRKILTKIRAILAVTLIIASGYTLAQEQEQPEPTEPNAEMLNFENWTVQCVRNDEDQKNCFLYQPILLRDGQRLLLFRVQKDVEIAGSDEPSDVAILTVPLGVHLPSGITLQVDEEEPFTLEYERCDQQGCFSGTVIDDALLNSFIGGSNCKVSFNDLSGQTITATLSLLGFTAGYNEM